MSSPQPHDHPTPDEPSPGLARTVYGHLRAIAQNQMNAERAGHTLTATALVHEAYLRLGDQEGIRDGGPAAFYYAAAEAMRRILIEHARAKNRLKRGGGLVRVPLEAIGDVADLDSIDRDHGESALAFDDAFRRLEGHDAQVADVVRLRFFAGLTVPETAAALGISERTVNNRWAYARAYLARELQGTRDDSPPTTTM